MCEDEKLEISRRRKGTGYTIPGGCSLISPHELIRRLLTSKQKARMLGLREVPCTVHSFYLSLKSVLSRKSMGFKLVMSWLLREWKLGFAYREACLSPKVGTSCHLR